MVKHIVFWSLLEEADGRSREENAKLIKAGLERLVGIVDGLRAAQVGTNLNGGDYDLCLYSEFDSMEHLKAYQTHPEHLKVRELVSKVRSARVAFDFEV